MLNRYKFVNSSDFSEQNLENCIENQNLNLVLDTFSCQAERSRCQRKKLELTVLKIKIFLNAPRDKFLFFCPTALAVLCLLSGTIALKQNAYSLKPR